jgi:hypothetical protein
LKDNQLYLDQTLQQWLDHPPSTGFSYQNQTLVFSKENGDEVLLPIVLPDSDPPLLFSGIIPHLPPQSGGWSFAGSLFNSSGFNSAGEGEPGQDLHLYRLDGDNAGTGTAAVQERTVLRAPLTLPDVAESQQRWLGLEVYGPRNLPSLLDGQGLAPTLGGSYAFEQGSGDSGFVKSAGALIRPSAAHTTLIFPHIPADTTNFWSGMALVNPHPAENHLTIQPFKADGAALNPVEMTLPPLAKQVALFSTLLPAGSEWFRLSGDLPLAGLELFGTHTTIKGTSGVEALPDRSFSFARLLPLTLWDNNPPSFSLKGTPWQGLVFLNPSAETVSFTASLYTSAGEVAGTLSMTLAAQEKATLLYLNGQLTRSRQSVVSLDGAPSHLLLEGNTTAGLLAFVLGGDLSFDLFDGGNALEPLGHQALLPVTHTPEGGQSRLMLDLFALADGHIQIRAREDGILKVVEANLSLNQHQSLSLELEAPFHQTDYVELILTDDEGLPLENPEAMLFAQVREWTRDAQGNGAYAVYRAYPALPGLPEAAEISASLRDNQPSTDLVDGTLVQINGSDWLFEDVVCPGCETLTVSLSDGREWTFPEDGDEETFWDKDKQTLTLAAPNLLEGEEVTLTLQGIDPRGEVVDDTPPTFTLKSEIRHFIPDEALFGALQAKVEPDVLDHLDDFEDIRSLTLQGPNNEGLAEIEVDDLTGLDLCTEMIILRLKAQSPFDPFFLDLSPMTELRVFEWNNSEGQEGPWVFDLMLGGSLREVTLDHVEGLAYLRIASHQGEGLEEFALRRCADLRDVTFDGGFWNRENPGAGLIFYQLPALRDLELPELPRHSLATEPLRLTVYDTGLETIEGSDGIAERLREAYGEVGNAVPLNFTLKHTQGLPATLCGEAQSLWQELHCPECTFTLDGCPEN